MDPISARPPRRYAYVDDGVRDLPRFVTVTPPVHRPWPPQRQLRMLNGGFPGEHARAGWVCGAAAGTGGIHPGQGRCRARGRCPGWFST